MEFYIHKNFIGSSRHVYCNDESFYFINNISKPDLLCVGTKDYFEIANLHLLENAPRVFPISKKYRTIFENFHLETKNNIPWELTMDEEDFEKELNLLIDLIRTNLNEDFSYYKNHYKRQQILFDSIQSAKINTKKFTKHLFECKNFVGAETQKQCLTTFFPVNGFSKIPKYDRFSSKTGRLTLTKNSPQILRLNKDYRDIIESRFGANGNVYEFDYSSLEPRVLLAINGETNISEDVYSFIIEKAGLKNTDRNVIKQIILSRIYGAGEKLLELNLKNAGFEYDKKIVGVVDEYFGIEKTKDRLLVEYKNNNQKFIQNFYGRKIFCDNVAPYVLLNYYIQSTAVDVAMFGFKNIVERIAPNQNLNKFIIPIFILHDAIWFDIHNKFRAAIEKICVAGSEQIPLFENCNFYLKKKNLSIGS